MGGDIGPATIVAGIARARRKSSALRFELFGDEAQIKPEIAKHKGLAGAVNVHHAIDAIQGSEKPSQAIRRAKTTSMGMAINAVNDLVMLDLGANTECDAQNLVQFAVMGAAYARTALSIDKPRVKLLNIGTEELKGTGELKEAAAMLREADYLPFQFTGFTEGDQLSRGEVDVVVTDGFSGNIALKTAEGTARFVTDLLRRAFTSSLRSKAGFALSRPALHMLKVHLDPNNHNGAVFLGLNGLVVKSHGSATPKGVANAIGVTARMIANDITRKIGDDLDNFRAHAFSDEVVKNIEAGE